MMDYKNYDLISFLKDEGFKKWVIEPDISSDMFWQEFLKAHPDKKADFQKARQIILSLHYEEFHKDPEDKYEIFRNIIVGTKTNRGLDYERIELAQKENKHAKLFMKIAASFLLVLGFLFLIYNEINPTDDEIAVSQILKENPSGLKSTIKLPDGSIVKLNSESRISFPEHFNATERIVHLKGEAFFEVAKDPERPFSVISGSIITTALGTSFNVQAWQKENVIHVAVAEGKIAVSKLSESENVQKYFLAPGEMIVHDIQSDLFRITKFNRIKELGWKDGLIVFHHASLGEFIKKLSRWFDVEFEVRGSQKEPWSIDGKFDNESLKEILESLSYTYKIDYKLENKKVILFL